MVTQRDKAVRVDDEAIIAPGCFSAQSTSWDRI